ncbi:hypothetical protein BLOT_011675 [Blomia tropicalis]|nr:hypothetical protein BLOT_011675 [Blomia tropicalis]
MKLTSLGRMIDCEPEKKHKSSISVRHSNRFFVSFSFCISPMQLLYHRDKPNERIELIAY